VIDYTGKFKFCVGGELIGNLAFAICACRKLLIDSQLSRQAGRQAGRTTTFETSLPNMAALSFKSDLLLHADGRGSLFLFTRTLAYLFFCTNAIIC